MDPPGRAKAAPIPHTFYLHIVAEPTRNVPGESTWLGTQPKFATIHVVLHWAEIRVMLSQRLGEIFNYWELCCDAVLSSSHGKKEGLRAESSF